jgi:hypothetical protein
MSRFSITIILLIMGTLAVAVSAHGLHRAKPSDVAIIDCWPFHRVEAIDVSTDVPELCASGASCALCLSNYREIGFIIKGVTSLDEQDQILELGHVVYTLIR